MRAVFCFVPVFLFFGSLATAGESLTVAVAANFAIPLEEIGLEFEKESGISLQTTVSSTGKLFTQIKNGAPYDLFFAADSLRPELLFQEDLGRKPFVYARGQTVLWTADKTLCKKGSWQEAVTAQGAGKIGIANPKTAPYGEAAEQALQLAGLWGDVFRKLVFAGNVGQSAQYASMGSVRMSFTAGSFTASSHGQKGCFWHVPEADAVIQKACIIKRSEKKDAAEQFLTFLHSPEAREVLRRYQYN